MKSIKPNLIGIFERVSHWLRFNLLYLGKPPWDTNQSPPELFEFIESHQPGAALDLGCGTGKNCLTLAQAGWQVTGVDFIPNAIRSARQRFGFADLQGTFFVSDVTDIKGMDLKYDLVLDMGCYHGLSDRAKLAYHTNLRRVLKPGGNFLLYAHAQYLFDGKNFEIPSEITQKLFEFLSLEKRENGRDPGGKMGVWLWFTKAG